MVFDKWNECSLGELANLKYGKTIRKKELSDDGYPVFSGYAIVGYLPTFDYEEPQLIIVCRGVGGTGDIKLSPAKSSITNLSIIIDSDPSKIDKSFLYWYLKHADTHSLRTGSAQPQIVIKDLEKFKIKIPPMSEQKAIANILSTLDEKIETNNKINKKLEEMAQALFKHWFVDFEFPNENGKPYKSSGGEMVESELGMIPKGWNVVTLEKIAELIMGLSPKSSTYNEDGIGLPLLNGAADFDKNNLRPSRFTSDPKRVSKKEDWLLCIRGTIGNLTFSDGDYALGRGVAAIRAKESMYREIIYFNLQKSIKELISLASGSVISGLSKQDINNLKIITPDKKILTVFHNLIHKIQQEQIDLKSQNKVLSKIRDILLPKLMSGEIRVPLDNETLVEQS
ncbi:restriction endonuclease subunit S [Aneurinibacillus thermoaerophilus]|uniref:restriction endonuclease subunit S n=1 Tax=Aneurinibacillus thermoaerophilus TaxID=143495 RepID=UPI002E1EA4EE|nr:restriction endonuclease subunit S [Aneurinibacillus thermoaerophilus]MED0758424.1 restriction endonuclease subunit S [Aneurinibacillus thermoaerophilus]MED0760559.1 restriction endonuclease subunit S [Aneurinibacillus thermoaerophilus]